MVKGNNRNSVATSVHQKIAQLSPKQLHPIRNHSNNITRIQWHLGKSESTSVRKGLLPQLLDPRLIYLSQKQQKKPSSSGKINFKQLLPIREITRQDKVNNYRKIRDQFKEVVNMSNQISVSNDETLFRAYVGKGNNGILVKQVIKKRWWWHLVDQPQKANFIWTQWFYKPSTILMNDICCQSRQQIQQQQQKLDQPRYQSIKKLIDNKTFTKLKNRISLKQQNYLKIKNNTQISNLNQKQSSINDIIHNHVQGCLELHSKKLLFKNIYSYYIRLEKDPFLYIPRTYYIDSDHSCSLKELYDYCSNVKEGNNMWLVKPGQNSNRGHGITIHSGKEQLETQIFKRLRQGRCSIIVQKYIENCYLIQGRKFDIRCYLLVTTVNGILKGYWYEDGYIRTSSVEYDTQDCHNVMIHLTNDAIQKHHSSYGKFQDFNKVSFDSFKKYLKNHGKQQIDFQNVIKRMKNIAYDLLKSVHTKIKRKQYTFEVSTIFIQLFGLDYMLDSELNPLLIEANSNPCLDNSGIILGKLIYQLIDNVLMTAVDPLFPVPKKAKFKQILMKDYFKNNKFEHIYTEL